MAEPESPPLVRRVTGREELEALLAEEPLVLAEFYTRSCPKCAAQEPVLGVIAREFDGVVAMVDPGEGMGLFREYGIQSTPGFVRFVDGEAVATLAEGFVPGERLLAFATGDLDQ
ncbi:MAG: thioredoxin family protein [Halobacteriaceae archaeon]